MKRIFLLIVIPALLVAMGFAQTPAASGNTDQINVKGCVAGSDGNYTVAENNTGKIFKITTSSTDLKAYVGQDVNLTGQAGTAENSLAITALNMISVHCVTAAAAPAATVSAPAETVSTPPVAATAPAAAAPAATVSTPAETVSTPPVAATAPAAAAPAATVSTPAETVSTPPVAATAPAAAAPATTVSTPAETVSTPPAAAAPTAAPTMSMPMETASVPAAAPVHHARPSVQPRKPAVTPAAAPTPAKPVATPVAETAVPATSFGPPAETASTPPTPAAPLKKASIGRSTEMLVAIVVVLLLIGTGVPLYNRWRRQKLAERMSHQNLSFTNVEKSDPGKSDTSGGRKAA